MGKPLGTRLWLVLSPACGKLKTQGITQIRQGQRGCRKALQIKRFPVATWN
jgi:hypothetical protein